MKKISLKITLCAVLSAGIVLCAILFVSKQPLVTIVHGTVTNCMWCGKILTESLTYERKWGFSKKTEFGSDFVRKMAECGNCMEMVPNFEVSICKYSGIPYRRAVVRQARHLKAEGRTVAKVQGRYHSPTMIWFVLEPEKEDGYDVKIVLHETGGEIQSKLNQFNKIPQGEYTFYRKEPPGRKGRSVESFYKWIEEVRANAEELLAKRDTYLRDNKGKAHTSDISKALLLCAAGDIHFREDHPRAMFKMGNLFVTILPHRRFSTGKTPSASHPRGRPIHEKISRFNWSDPDFCKWDVEVEGPNDKGDLLSRTRTYWVKDGKILPIICWEGEDRFAKQKYYWDVSDYPEEILMGHFISFFSGSYLDARAAIYAVLINDYILKTGWKPPKESVSKFLVIYVDPDTKMITRFGESIGPKSLVDLFPDFNDTLSGYEKRGKVSGVLSEKIRSYGRMNTYWFMDRTIPGSAALLEQVAATGSGDIVGWYKVVTGVLVDRCPGYMNKHNPWGIPDGEELVFQWALDPVPGIDNKPFPENWFKQ
jgi:hypothetical protein